eukprot:475253-Rhodomonas_salina.3
MLTRTSRRQSTARCCTFTSATLAWQCSSTALITCFHHVSAETHRQKDRQTRQRVRGERGDLEGRGADVDGPGAPAGWGSVLKGLLVLGEDVDAGEGDERAGGGVVDGALLRDHVLGEREEGLGDAGEARFAAAREEVRRHVRADVAVQLQRVPRGHGPVRVARRVKRQRLVPERQRAGLVARVHPGLHRERPARPQRLQLHLCADCICFRWGRLVDREHHAVGAKDPALGRGKQARVLQRGLRGVSGERDHVVEPAGNVDDALAVEPRDEHRRRALDRVALAQLPVAVGPEREHVRTVGENARVVRAARDLQALVLHQPLHQLRHHHILHVPVPELPLRLRRCVSCWRSMMEPGTFRVDLAAARERERVRVPARDQHHLLVPKPLHQLRRVRRRARAQPQLPGVHRVVLPARGRCDFDPRREHHWLRARGVAGAPDPQLSVVVEPEGVGLALVCDRDRVVVAARDRGHAHVQQRLDQD